MNKYNSNRKQIPPFLITKSVEDIKDDDIVLISTSGIFDNTTYSPKLPFVIWAKYKDLVDFSLTELIIKLCNRCIIWRYNKVPLTQWKDEYLEKYIEFLLKK